MDLRIAHGNGCAAFGPATAVMAAGVERRLAVIDVADRPDADAWLGALEPRLPGPEERCRWCRLLGRGRAGLGRRRAGAWTERTADRRSASCRHHHGDSCPARRGPESAGVGCTAERSHEDPVSGCRRTARTARTRRARGMRVAWALLRCVIGPEVFGVVRRGEEDAEPRTICVHLVEVDIQVLAPQLGLFVARVVRTRRLRPASEKVRYALDVSRGPRRRTKVRCHSRSPQVGKGER